VRAFVTGGTGFVGSHLIHALQAAGHEPVCLVRSPRKAAAVFGGAMPTVVDGSLGDRAALRRGCDGCDTVFHVAGLTAGRTPQELMAANRDRTRDLVEVAKASGSVRRFVYVSSLAAAGPAPPGTPRHEEAPEQPVSNYGRSKLAGEQVVRQSKLDWTIVRPPAVYGPRDTEMLKLFRILRWHVAPLIVDRAQELSFVHVADLAHALVVAAGPGGERTTYFATHEEVVTARALITLAYRAVHPETTRDAIVFRLPRFVTTGALTLTYLAARAVGRRTLLSPDKAREFRQAAWTCSSDAITADLGWRATRSLADGLPETMRWYREHALL
jgi:nucleoside-diphosphate-sugar epimerase